MDLFQVFLQLHDQEFHDPIIVFITEIFIAFKPRGLVKVQAAEFTRSQLNLEA